MWMILALVMSLALFALLSLTHMEQDQNAVYRTALSTMENQSAQQMDSFTTAAWAYVTANSVSTGATISVAQLVSAGYLPTAFTDSNPFGQTLVALTGTGTLAAYYQNPPNTLYGMPVIPRTEKGVAMKMAEKLSAMQENAPEYVAAISYNGGTGAYTQALLPYATTALTMSANDPQFSTAFPSLLDLVNVLPATGLSAGAGATAATASTNSACGTPQLFNIPGTYQVAVPTCAKSATAILAGGGGGNDSGEGGTGYNFSGTVTLASTSEVTVLVGGAGVNGDLTDNVGGGGGGLSALCSGSSCTASSVMMIAGGGGGSGAMGDPAIYDGKNAGLTNESSSSLADVDGGPGYGGSGSGSIAAVAYAAGGFDGSYGYGHGGYGGGGAGGDYSAAGDPNYNGGGGGGGYNGGYSGYSIHSSTYGYVGYGGGGGQSYYGQATNIQVGTPTPSGNNGVVVITFNQ